MSESDLIAEVERLRAENASYRQREVEDLKTQLAAAREAAEHYRNEAIRLAATVHEVNRMAEESISRLKAQVEAAERTQLQSIRNRPRANAGRN